MPTTMPTTMPANATRCQPMLPDASQCYQMPANAIKCQPMLPYANNTPIPIDGNRRQSTAIPPYQLIRHKNNKEYVLSSIVLNMSSILSSCPSLAPCAPISICPPLSSPPCASLRLGTTPSFCPNFCPHPYNTKIRTTGCVARFDTF